MSTSNEQCSFLTPHLLELLPSAELSQLITTRAGNVPKYQSSLVGFQKSVLMSTSVCESTNEQIIAHPRSQNASDVLCFVSSLGFPNCTFSPFSNFF